MFLPLVADGARPIWFVEIQFYRNPNIYANLFAKVFHYLDMTGPNQPWIAVVLFAERSLDPPSTEPYRLLLDSSWTRRVFLDELQDAPSTSLGYAILLFVGFQGTDALDTGRALVERAEKEMPEEKSRRDVIELIETLVLAKFPTLTRKELATMLKLEDVRRSRIWQEAAEEGKIEGKVEGKSEGRREAKLELVPKLAALGLNQQRIAEMLDLPVEVIVQELERSPRE